MGLYVVVECNGFVQDVYDEANVKSMCRETENCADD